MKSVRKTPFQNLEECSAVKLKGSTAMIGSPVRAARSGGGAAGERGRGMMSRPKVCVYRRTAGVGRAGDGRLLLLLIF